MGDAE